MNLQPFSQNQEWLNQFWSCPSFWKQTTNLWPCWKGPSPVSQAREDLSMKHRTSRSIEDAPCGIKWQTGGSLVLQKTYIQGVAVGNHWVFSVISHGFTYKSIICCCYLLCDVGITPHNPTVKPKINSCSSIGGMKCSHLFCCGRLCCTSMILQKNIQCILRQGLHSL